MKLERKGSLECFLLFIQVSSIQFHSSMICSGPQTVAQNRCTCCNSLPCAYKFSNTHIPTSFLQVAQTLHSRSQPAALDSGVKYLIKLRVHYSEFTNCPLSGSYPDRYAKISKSRRMLYYCYSGLQEWILYNRRIIYAFRKMAVGFSMSSR